MVIKEVTAIAGEVREKIKALSAFSLPVNPAERGMTPEQIKLRFYTPILGASASALSELERVISELNSALSALDALLSGGSATVGEGQKTLDELILLTGKDNQTLKEGVENLLLTKAEMEATKSALEYIKEEVAAHWQSTWTGAIEAKKAQDEAAEAKDGAEAARDRILNLKVATAVLPYSDEPSVEKTEVGGETQLIFRLPVGKPFRAAKVFASVAEMDAGYASDGVSPGEFVVINTGNVEDEENARLYLKGDDAYVFVTDLSGAAGIQGENGYTPVRGVDYMNEGDYQYFDAHIDERLDGVEESLEAIADLQEALIGGEST